MELTGFGDSSTDGLRQAGSVAISRGIHDDHIAGF